MDSIIEFQGLGADKGFDFVVSVMETFIDKETAHNLAAEVYTLYPQGTGLVSHSTLTQWATEQVKEHILNNPKEGKNGK